VFERLRRKREGRHVLLYAFDLLELNGTDLRRDPLVVRKPNFFRPSARGRLVHQPQITVAN
jgi:ATP-dependent DNA ligase